MPDVEVWLPVEGFDYEVSSMGKVRGKNGELRPLRASDGHFQVALYRDKKPNRKLVHRIVLETFIGPCPEGMETCHGDGNPAHNWLSNLRWGTQGDNMRDRVRHGTHHEAIKTLCPKNHPLVEGNLSLAHLRKGKRVCLTCIRDRDLIRNRKRRAKIAL